MQVPPTENNKAGFQFTATEQAEIDRFCAEYGADVNAVDHIGKTLLFKAANEWSVAVVKFLVSKGADVNAKDNQSFTPFHSAASNVESLVSNGANISLKDKDGKIPLDVAKEWKNMRVAEYLINVGAGYTGMSQT